MNLNMARDPKSHVPSEPKVVADEVQGKNEGSPTLPTKYEELGHCFPFPGVTHSALLASSPTDADLLFGLSMRRRTLRTEE